VPKKIVPREGPKPVRSRDSGFRLLAFVLDDDNRTRRLLMLLYPVTVAVLVVVLVVTLVVVHLVQVGALLAGFSGAALLSFAPLRRALSQGGRRENHFDCDEDESRSPNR
jgi:ABC-type transport system involved in cytochrome bd biosynthesis fused ATPase/permease subunit